MPRGLEVPRARCGREQPHLSHVWADPDERYCDGSALTDPYDLLAGTRDSDQGRISEEVRVVSETGGEKGRKRAELGAVDPDALMALARVAGFGAQKYATFNFVKGYDWSLSYNALQRHLHAFWAGEDFDPESGERHLAHAAWHCLTLITFAERDRGTDDRIARFIEGLTSSD